ncbi:MAG: OmpA family protein [Myxococcota bacterium]
MKRSPLLRIWTAALATTAWMLPALAVAQQEDVVLPALQVQQFRPAIGPGDFLDVYGSPVLEHLDWDVHAYLDYADAPLQVASSTDAFNQALDFQTTLTLAGVIGIRDRFELGYMLPLTLLQASQELEPVILNEPTFSTDELSSVAINDSRISGKWRILDLSEDKLGFALVAAANLPLATRNTLTSDAGFGAEAIAVVDKFLYGGIRGGANLGYRFRPGTRDIRQNTIGSELLWGFGVGIPLFYERMDALAELDGAINLAPASEEVFAGIQDGEVHTEGRVALRYKLSERWTLTAGLGSGFSRGIGSPNIRAIIGVGGYWVTGGEWGYDYDGDGIYGKRDACPNEAEDYDGFEDFDGCPDLDNDRDGVPDKFDECNNTPDEVDVKNNGCPDDDLDGDGIPNKYDQCPEDPEDRDRFEDSDGCPDLDNDGDGLTDREDECPNEPETKNAHLDEDGCPDDPDEKVVFSKNKLIITEPVYFATGKAKILNQSKPILDEVASVLEDNAQIDLLRIEGHTDSRGRDASNLRLSQERASAVRAYLIDQGIDKDRLEAVGYGETQPIADNETDEGRAKNRRVEFTIIDR